MKTTKRQRQKIRQAAIATAEQRVNPDKVFAQHKQYNGNFCAASAHEFIMKLHRKLPLTAFPLQANPASVNGGWTFPEFLEFYGFFQTTHKPSDAAEAMKRITREVHAARYPLLAVLPPWHIVVALKDQNEIRLADPRDKKFITQTSAQTKAEIEAVIKNGGRPYLDMLTYG
jgi:hypothetical protein